MISRYASAHLVCVLLLVGTSNVTAQTSTVKSAQVSQQRAQQLARQLLEGALNKQLRHLEQNGLQKTPLYESVRSLREQMSVIADKQMASVAAKLQQLAKTTDPQQRKKQIVAVTNELHDLVLLIAAERQKLTRRLRMNELVLESTKLLTRQIQINERTASLSRLQPSERESALLSLTGQQRTSHRLYLQLVELMRDSQGWEGQAGVQAAKGLQVASATRLNGTFATAVKALNDGNFASAIKPQHGLAQGLRTLLTALQSAKSDEQHSRGLLIRRLGDLVDRQRTVLQKTTDQPLNENRGDELSTEQAKIGRRIAELLSNNEIDERIRSLLQTAQNHSVSATDALFQTSQAKAAAEQNRVVQQLVSAVAALKDNASLDQSQHSADRLATIAQRLKRLLQTLKEIEPLNAQARESLPDRNGTALAPLRSAQAKLRFHLSQDLEVLTVRLKLVQTLDTLEATRRSLNDRAPAPEQQEKMVAYSQAFDRLVAEAAARFADLQRMQLAVRIGELARAAEALERTAAAQHRWAKQLVETGNKTEVISRQRMAADAVSAIGRGVANSAPGVAKDLAKLALWNGTLSDQMRTIPPQEGAESLHETATDTELIAGRLRKAQMEHSLQLAQLAAEQATQTGDLEKEVRQFHGAAKKTLNTNADRLDQMDAALAAAETAQAAAAGKMKLAQALRASHQLQSIAEKQRAASSAADDFERGKSPTALSAISRQQEVADALQKTADSDLPDAVAAQLPTLSKAARRAADELLGGNRERARSARRSVEEGLKQALQQSAQLAADKASETGKPSASHQRQSLNSLREFKSLLKGGGPSLAALNESASAASAAASAADRALRNGQAEVAATQQAAATAGMQSLRRQFAGAKRALQAGRSQAAEKVAQLAASKQHQLGAASPESLQTLRHIARTAKSAAQQIGRSASGGKALTESIRRTQAELAVRHQDLENDKEIADTMARLAAKQQEARSAIAKNSVDLQRLSALAPDQLTKESNARRVKAAEGLRTAADSFAEAQKATGEGAVQISGQHEVANPDLKEGLRLASALSGGDSPGKGKGNGPGKKPPGSNTGNRKNDPSKTPNDQNTGNSKPSDDGQLGSGLVPSSPETTAQQIAGQQAMQAADQVLKDAKRNSSDSDQPSDNATAKNDGNSSGSKKDPNADNGKKQPTQPTDADAASSKARIDGNTRDRDGDANIRAKAMEKESWFARLPPTLRDAVRASARQRPPRGYEDRLRRYFEGLK